VSYNKQTVY